MLNSLLKNPHITVFGFDIYWYAIIIVTGIIVAMLIATFLMKKRGASPDIVLTLFCSVMPFAFIGLRVYYCVFADVPLEDWFSFEGIRSGGLAIYGGVIGGVLAGIVVCRIMKIEFLKMIDCIMPGVLLAQAIGRWANFVNDEAHGDVVTNPNLQWFPYAYRSSNGQWVQATFFWESILSLIGAVLLIYLAIKLLKKPNGLIGCGYFVWYGVERFIVEGFRTDSLYWGPIRVSQLVAVVLIVLGAAAIAYLLYRNKKLEGEYFGSKFGEPLVTSRRSEDTRALNIEESKKYSEYLKLQQELLAKEANNNQGEE